MVDLIEVITHCCFLSRHSLFLASKRTSSPLPASSHPFFAITSSAATTFSTTTLSAPSPGNSGAPQHSTCSPSPSRSGRDWAKLGGCRLAFGNRSAPTYPPSIEIEGCYLIFGPADRSIASLFKAVCGAAPAHSPPHKL